MCTKKQRESNEQIMEKLKKIFTKKQDQRFDRIY